MTTSSIDKKRTHFKDNDFAKVIPREGGKSARATKMKGHYSLTLQIRRIRQRSRKFAASVEVYRRGCPYPRNPESLIEIKPRLIAAAAEPAVVPSARAERSFSPQRIKPH